MSAHPGASFGWLREHICGVLRSTASNAMHDWGKKLCVIYTSPKVTMLLCIGGCS